MKKIYVFLTFKLPAHLKQLLDYHYYSEQETSIIISYAIKAGIFIGNSINNLVKTHSYIHYKLPITMNSLKYGKLLYSQGNIYIIQINNNNVIVISEKTKYNYVILYKFGELVLK